VSVDSRTRAVYDSKAADYAEMVKSEQPHISLAEFIGLFPPGARVLDLGCGPGDAAAAMRDAGLAPDALDASPAMVDLANRTHDIGARCATFDDLDARDAYAGVWASFSLLHATREDLPRYLAAIAQSLVQDGILSIGMKVGEGAGRDGLGRFYTYVGVKELAVLLAEAGLEVLSTREGQERGLAGTLDPYVIMLARKTGNG
jgi:SAM-dependent methyltransferase